VIQRRVHGYHNLDMILSNGSGKVIVEILVVSTKARWITQLEPILSSESAS
jgi:hypothetical protein